MLRIIIQGSMLDLYWQDFEVAGFPVFTPHSFSSVQVLVCVPVFGHLAGIQLAQVQFVEQGGVQDWFKLGLPERVPQLFLSVQVLVCRRLVGQVAGVQVVQVQFTVHKVPGKYAPVISLTPE